jgi:hypothetical protein
LLHARRAYFRPEAGGNPVERSGTMTDDENFRPAQDAIGFNNEQEPICPDYGDTVSRHHFWRQRRIARRLPRSACCLKKLRPEL